MLGLETSSSRMSWNGKSWFYYGRINEPREIVEIINKIDKSELEHLIDFCFNPSYYALTAIGPLKDDIFKGVFNI
jgi:predicted Zn-dependent peptidase